MRQKAPFLFTWAMMPGSYQAAALARAGLEGVLIDMQHGIIGYRDMVDMVGAINSAGGRALVRPPLEDYAMVSRALDAGAQAIVFPMINSPEDARKLVAVAKFPPVGERSWGAYVSMEVFGLDKQGYIERANDLAIVLAMVETADGLACLDEICAVEGLDGVFVGPNDLCISLTGGKASDVNHPRVQEVLPGIALAAKKAGKIAGIFVSDPSDISKFAAMGYSFMPAASDTGLIANGLADVTT